VDYVLISRKREVSPKVHLKEARFLALPLTCCHRISNQLW